MGGGQIASNEALRLIHRVMMNIAKKICVPFLEISVLALEKNRHCFGWLSIEISFQCIKA